MSTLAEKRLSNRKSMNIPVVISSTPSKNKEAPLKAMTSNLSFNGLCLYTNEEDILLDHQYKIEFTVLVRGYYLSLDINAKAVYKKTHAYHRYIIGFQFTDITSESQDKLDTILNPQPR